LAADLKTLRLRKREPLLLELIPENLLREPIEYIFADHYRLRQIIATTSRFLATEIFTSPPDAETAPEIHTIRDYLADELPIHMADEEEDLFPCLVQHCPDDDETKQILAVLRQEHAEDLALLPSITAGLDDLLAGRQVADWPVFAASVAHFVERQRRHIIWENNIILPLARRHFTADDMARIGREMAARRNVEFPG